MSRTSADIPSSRPKETSDGVGGGQLFELPAPDPALIWCLVSTFVFGLVAHGYRMGATMPGGLAWGPASPWHFSPAPDAALYVAGLALLPLTMNWEYVVTRGFIHDLMTFSLL